jgi:S-adenosyl methyltransferase
VAISHFFDPENEYTEVAHKMEHHFAHSTMGSDSFRTRAELLALFEGLELIEPGLAPCVGWWPDGPPRLPRSDAQHCIAGAVGRKP